MKIVVNGQVVEVTEGETLCGYLLKKGLPLERIVVELNQEIVRSEKWAQVFLKEDDHLEILRFVGGG